MEKRILKRLPELLAPAGSREALEAAIAAGADAVYMGCSGFNARIGAKNFTLDEMHSAFDLCRAHGVKTNITLNTLVSDREMHEFLNNAYRILTLGADALIVADIGAATLLRKYFPEAELHASTQLSVHNSSGVKFMSELGFSRVVVARELPRNEIEEIVKRNFAEIEMFVHGALCVSHSGQCLASSLIGGRSGNRGLCAQPCRLPYNGKYPLSLKDSCLASHIDEILSLDVSSLKIEGRMKPAEYVFGVVKIYRKLLDERRCATEAELAELAEIFSRSGFTDKYFTEKLTNSSSTASMLGIRTESDKANSRASCRQTGSCEKLPVDITVSIKNGKESSYTVTSGDVTATVYGAVPQRARTAPLDRENVSKRAAKLGDTPYVARNVAVELDRDLMLPVSELNSMRRRAIAKLLGDIKQYSKLPDNAEESLKRQRFENFKKTRSARFITPEQINALGEAKSYFDRIYLPLQDFDASCGANGVVLPPVAFDSETETLVEMMKTAYKNGARYALVSNLSQIEVARSVGFELHGDFRLNIWNSFAAEKLLQSLESVMVSPELSLAQARDIPNAKSIIVYGRIPLMLMERCIIKDAIGCDKCQNTRFFIKDRTQTEFFVTREFEHRNVMYNSVPVYMADRKKELKELSCSDEHFIFSCETSGECLDIVNAYKSGRAPEGNARRIK
jgi:putative protease